MTTTTSSGVEGTTIRNLFAFAIRSINLKLHLSTRRCLARLDKTPAVLPGNRFKSISAFVLGEPSQEGNIVNAPNIRTRRNVCCFKCQAMEISTYPGR
mmetsp:Transcript_75533/g.151828  ORF Transcript_75533/g.151828 Transcript_75533/m.151828 type:complete len:98 (-) Transcript_75533:110-403(-)